MQQTSIWHSQSMHSDLDATCTGAKVATVVNAIIALRSKLGGGNEFPLVTPSGNAGIVRPRPYTPGQTPRL